MQFTTVPEHIQEYEKNFDPIRLLEIELTEPLPVISAIHPERNLLYKSAVILLRCFTHPIHMLQIDLAGESVAPADYVNAIWSDASGVLNQFLQDQGLSPVDTLPVAGLQFDKHPKFLLEQEKWLADAPMVSVVVPTRNRSASLKTCLKSLLELDYPNYEVIVVDNAPSDDSTHDMIKAHYDGQVRYMREERPGTSYARNAGAAVAKGTIIARADDDIRADKHWLTGIVRGFMLSDNVACVNGLAMPAELESPSQLWFEEYGGFNRGFQQVAYDMGENRPKKLFFPFVSGVTGTGANMALRKDVYDEIGGSDPGIGPGSPVSNGEDIDIYFRLLMMGYTIVYEPTALIHHYHRRDYNKLRKQIYGYGLGFTAHLTKSLLTHPAKIPEFLIKLPYGVYLMLGKNTVHNEKKSETYPEELSSLERQGMMRGPYAFFKGQWVMYQRRRNQSTEL